MQIIESRAELQALSDQERALGKRIALVPTMGALHAGHLSLVDTAHQHADRAWLSLFVNPTQFNDPVDFESYPDTREQDLALCRQNGVDVVWLPSVDEMYPDGAQSWVEVKEISKPLCGKNRPEHFLGVSTVVTKLFLAAKPHVAVFGEKDYQQLAIIRRMVQDLGFDLQIVGAPTVREPDGLAMSSRNVHLTPTAREEALVIVRALDAVEQAFLRGERDLATMLQTARQQLTTATSGTLEYLEICDADTLRSVSTDMPERVLIAIAMAFKTGPRADDSVRLIDNRVLED